MINKKVTLAAVTGLMVSQLVIVPLGGAAPQNPQDVKPADNAENVSLNPVLGATVSDSEGSNLKKVEFLQGNIYDFSVSGDKIAAFQQTTTEDPLTVTGKEAATAFTDADKKAAAFADNNNVITAGTNAFPAHRFEVSVSDQPAAGEKVEIYWEGKSTDQGVINLSAWNYATGKWEVLKKSDANKEGSDIILTADVDPAKFLSGGKIQAMVHDSSPGSVIEGEASRMLWFTDTQFYTQDHPEIWDSMTDWMIAEYEKGAYEYVFNTGDIVQTPENAEEWAVADKNFARLDAAGIPYGVVAGNHDVNFPRETFSYEHYFEYFGSDRYEHNHWYGGHMDNNRNHYDLITAGGEEFIMMYLGYGTEATPATVAWASDALKKHSDRSAILALHWYITPDLTYPTANAYNVNEKIVKPNENIKMVLSGHYLNAARRSVTHKNADGTERQVLEVLANYQGSEYQSKRGGGYLRMIDFKPASGQVSFSTYSPYYNDYNYYEDEKDNFTESFQFESSGTSAPEADRSISTDYFGVNVFKAASIGKVENIASGKRAEVQWKNLAPQKQYFWYMKITNASDETKWTKINRFKTGNEEIPAAPAAPAVNPVSDKDQKVSGTAETGTTIIVAKGSAELNRGKTNADGKYEIAIPAQPAGTVLSVTAMNANGLKSKAAEITVTATAAESADVKRVSGENRYATAVAISKQGWNESDTVVLATGAEFPDALAGGPLAHKLGAPILLTRTGSLNAETKAELLRLKTSNVVILGGSIAVSVNVEKQLKDMGITVTRKAGKNRFETAALIAKEIGSSQAVVVQGFNFPDVLSISPYAAKNSIPILMTRVDRLPAETAAALQGKNKTYVIGGTLAVSEEVMKKLPAPTRYGGKTRFDTAKKIITELPLGTDKAFVSTGMEFPDALTGGVLAAKNNGPVLLVKQDSIPAPMESILTDYNSFTVFGGTIAVSDKVVNQLKAVLD